MSITFEPQPGMPVGFRVGCSCESNLGPVFGTYADAEEFYRSRNLSAGSFLVPEVLEGCEYAGQPDFCEMSSPFIKAVFEEDAPSLNVSMGNAIDILEVLGMPTEVRDCGFGPMPMDCYGEMDADDFLGRVLTAQAMSVGGVAKESETVVDHPAGMTLIFVGRRESYVEDRLADLAEIAAWAKAHGVRVQWS